MFQSIAKLLVIVWALVQLTTCAPIGDRSGSALESREPFRVPNFRDFQQAKQVIRNMRKLNPLPNSQVFWSGKIPHKNNPKGHSVSPVAQQYAKDRKKHTINMAIRAIRNPVPHPKKNPLSHRIWEATSRIWAKKAKGEVHAVLGPKQDAKSVWNRIEKPALMKNPHVHKIVAYNPKTKVSHIIKGKK